MRIYIAYKFTNVENKETVKTELLKLAEIIDSLDHEHFLLIRDVKNWGHHTPLWQTVPHILYNVLKSDTIVALLTSEVKSSGLTIELAFAQCLGKRIILAVKENIFNEYTNIGGNSETFTFKDFEELEQKLKKSLTQTK